MTESTTAGPATAGPGHRALGRVVALDPARFGAEVWGRRPLLSPAGRLPAEFTDLFSARAVDELIAERGLRTPFLRMAKNGTVLPMARFTRGGGAGAGVSDQAADDKVLALLADGATLVLQGLHRTWPPLVRFAAQLSAELGHPIQVNAYITPAQNQGFAAHYDTHDVFVLQIAGHKRWRIHEPVLTAPLVDQPWESMRAEVATAADAAPVLEAELAPGDALYLPRGYLHSALALGEVSIHLTIGVHPLTRATVLDELLHLARVEPALRTSLPAGVDLADPDVLAGEVRQTIAALSAWLERDGAGHIRHVAERIGQRLRADTRPEPVLPLAQAAAADAVTGTSALRLRAGLRPDLRPGPALEVVDGTVTFAPGADAALKRVLSAAPFCPDELPGLDAEAQLDLARQLLRAGVVVPVSP